MYIVINAETRKTVEFFENLKEARAFASDCTMGAFGDEGEFIVVDEDKYEEC